MTVARRGLKVKVMGQNNTVGPPSIECSFFLVSSKTGFVDVPLVVLMMG